MRFAPLPWDMSHTVHLACYWSPTFPPLPPALRRPNPGAAPTTDAPAPADKTLTSPNANRAARRSRLQPKPLTTGPPPHVTARRAWREWRALGASGWVLRVLKDGLLLPWRRPPPAYAAPTIHQPPDVQAWGTTEVCRWVKQGYCRPATEAEARYARWQAATFVTDINRKPRLVVDLSPVNSWLHDRSFKYELLPNFITMLKKGDHMASWDVSDAFHHIRLAPRESARLAFRVGGDLYFPLTLPFGLKLAPWALTKLMRPVVQHLRSLGFLVLPYMDDFAISVDQAATVTEAQATKARQQAVALFRRLGLHVHPLKGAATGTTRLDLLGYTIDTTRCLLLLPLKRQQRIVGAAHSLLKSAAMDRRWVRARALRRFCGLAASATLAIPLSRLHLRSLFSSLGASKGRTRLTAAALRDLLWWSKLRSTVGIGRSLWESPTVMQLDTDACTTGWGAVRDQLTPARGFFDLATAHHHINRKELLAVIYALESFPSARGPGVVRIRTDSKVVMSVINSLCSRSPALHRDVAQLQQILVDRNLGIEATWLSSVENKWADRLSREMDSADWRIARSAWTCLDRAWGPMTIDRFATTLTTLLPRFNSAVACPGTEHVDTYTTTWAGDINYCAPPFAQAAAALRKCFQDRATAIFVLPLWPAQAWWRRAALRASAAVLLPDDATIYTRGRFTSPARPPSWQMVAFLFECGGTPPTEPPGGAWPTIPHWPPSARPALAPRLPPPS